MTILIVSFCAALMVFFIAGVHGPLHLLVREILKNIGRPAPRNGRVVMRSRFASYPPMVLAGIVVYTMLETVWLDGLPVDQSFAIWRSVVYTWVVGMCIMGAGYVLIVLSYIKEAYQSRRERFQPGLFGSSLLCFAALPFMSASLHFSVTLIDNVMVIVEESDPGTDLVDEIGRMPFPEPRGLLVEPPDSFCAEVLGVDSGSVRSEDGGALFEQVVGFWFDQALSGAFFDVADVMQCRVSSFVTNPDSLLAVAVVASYRMASGVMLLGILLWPVTRFQGWLLIVGRTAQERWAALVVSQTEQNQPETTDDPVVSGSESVSDDRIMRGGNRDAMEE